MERREIEIFLTLAEELHFGRTAERLLVSQARVSQTIAKLERRFGVALFERTSRRVALTPVGAALHAEVRAGHDRIEKGIAAAIAAGRGVTGTLTVGLEAPAVAELAADVFARFRSRHPGVEVVFRETGFTDPLDLLRAGEVDVAVTNAPVDEEGFEQGPEVYREPVVLAMAREHRLAGRRYLLDLRVGSARATVASAATRAVRCPRRQHSTQRTGGDPGSNGTMARLGRAK